MPLNEDANTTAEFDHVVLDTAPTGHTLRLLSLPAAWSGFIRNQYLVINAVFQALNADDPIAHAMQQRGQEALDSIPDGLTNSPRTELPLAPHNLIGIAALRAMLQGAQDEVPSTDGSATRLGVLPPSLAELIDQIA